MYSQNYADNSEQTDPAKKRRQIEMEMVILESDLRKFLAKRGELEADLRRLKKDQDRLRMEMDVKQAEQKIIVRKIEQSDEDVKRLKKQLNAL